MRSRAVRFGPGVEAISIQEVYEKDKGICWICGLSVPMETSVRALRPTVDHTVPLIKGGSHSKDNVHLAHYSCNCARRERSVTPAVRERAATRIGDLMKVAEGRV
jgi:5-methylcytosine-specific restriction endonuclease McrA